MLWIFIVSPHDSAVVDELSRLSVGRGADRQEEGEHQGGGAERAAQAGHGGIAEAAAAPAGLDVQGGRAVCSAVIEVHLPRGPGARLSLDQLERHAEEAQRVPVADRSDAPSARSAASRTVSGWPDHEEKSVSSPIPGRSIPCGRR